MKNSEKYVISEGIFDWLLKTLAGIADMKKAMEKSHYSDPGFDMDHLKRLQRGL